MQIDIALVHRQLQSLVEWSHQVSEVLKMGRILSSELTAFWEDASCVLLGKCNKRFWEGPFSLKHGIVK